jgi:hypothetical protein
MAPPMIRLLTLFSRLVMTLTLSLTLAPPRMATKGFSGLASALPRYSTSLLHQEAGHVGSKNLQMTAVEPWARCAVPKASFT